MLDRHNVCALCGVAFSVGRLRTASEPAEAALSDHRQWWPARNWFRWAGGCGKDSGCMVVFHHEWISLQHTITGGAHENQEGANRTYCDATLAFVRPIAGAALRDMNVAQFPSDRQSSEYIRVRLDSDPREKLMYVGDYEVWQRGNMRDIIEQRLQQEGFMLPIQDGSHLPDHAFEHIAGPGCQVSGDSAPYAGSRINASEMEMCHVAQNLSIRHHSMLRPGPTDLPDDDDWEQLPNVRVRLNRTFESKYTRCRTAGFIWRQDRESIFDSTGTLENWFRGPRRPGITTEFHPYCLEVFKRAALKRHGGFDMNGLGRWLQATQYLEIHDFPRHAAVQRSARYSWHCHVQDEWLVANPCYVLGLKAIVEDIGAVKSAKVDGSKILHEEVGRLQPNANIGASADVRADRACLIRPTGLVSLPVEILYQIFEKLPIETVANLAIVYPDLAPAVYATLLERIDSEWPYLWELWCHTPYSKWTTKQSCEVHKIYEEIKQEAYNTTDSRRPLPEGILKPICDRVFQKFGFTAQPALFFDVQDHHKRELIRLVAAVDDGLRTGRLKGLQNRARIWTDCESILDQIDRLTRATGEEWNMTAIWQRHWRYRKVSDVFRDILYGELDAHHSRM